MPGKNRFEPWWARQDPDDLPLALRHAASCVETFVQEAMEARGWPRLSISAIHLLRLLPNGATWGRSPSRLAESLRITRQAAAHVVAELRRHCLVTTESAAAGRRGFVLLTDRGERAQQAAHQAVQDVLSDVGDVVPDDLLARTVFALRLLAARDADEWLALVAVGMSLAGPAPAPPHEE